MNPPPSSSPIWRAGTLVYGTGGLIVLLCWLLGGDFALAMRDRAIPQVIQLLLGKLGASDMLTGLLFSSLPAALGLVAGPIVGYHSDRLRTRWGRRIPFLFATTPFIVASMVGLAFCVPLGTFLNRLLGSHSPGLDLCSLIVVGLFWGIFELGCIIANLVFQGLVNDVVPQKVMGRSMGLLRAFSLGAGVLFFYWGMAGAETHYVALFSGLAVFYGIGLTLMCLKIREGEYPSPPAPPEHVRGFARGIVTYFRDSFGHSYYLLYFVFIVLAFLAPSAFNLFSVFYAKTLGMSMELYGRCFALTFAVSICLAYPLGVLADRLHPLRLALASLILYALAMAWGALFVRDTFTFAIALIAHGILSGIFYTAAASLGQRLLPKARFTELSSAGGALSSLMGIAFAPALGFFLDRTGHRYSHTFVIGLIVTGLALSVGLILYRRFMAYGGTAAYRAPEFEEKTGRDFPLETVKAMAQR